MKCINKLFVFFGVIIFVMTSCSKNYHKYASKYAFKSYDSRPDYSNLNYWAAHPFKYDNSDSIPKPLQGKYKEDSLVDIFFVHPTTYMDKQKSLGYTADIDNAELNAKTDYTSILYQATAFNQVGRVFAPRYRQANINCYHPINIEDSLLCVAAFDTAYSDVKTAFEYFLKHLNKGRPFIIASHSQGTTHTKRLLKELIDGTELQSKLVAGYLIGIPVANTQFKKIPECTSPNQTGCVVSWRSYKEGFTPEYIEKEKFTVIVTNPLTWDNLQPIATRQQNLGGVFYNFNKTYEKTASAKVNGSVLWSSKPRFFGNVFLTTKNYHIADINMFYLNIKENAYKRINAYFLNTH